MTVRELRMAYGGRVVTCTVSVGVGQTGRSESIRDRLDRTDQALYRAKAEGRDRAVEASATE